MPSLTLHWTFDRAAVIGSGPMGVLLAAVLGRTMPVILVCRNAARAAELFQHGARTTGAIDAHAHPIIVRTLADIPTAGGAAAVFVATKTTAIPDVAADLAAVLPQLQQGGRPVYVISFQNGVDPGRELVERLGQPCVLRMVLSLGAVPDDAAHAVKVTLNSPPHIIGAIDEALHPVCEVIASALTSGGLETTLTKDIELAVWRKAIVNAAMNPVAALVNCTVGEVLDSPAHCIFERLLDEGIAVARAQGIALPGDYRETAVALTESARDHLPSMVEDIRLGRESEIGQLNRQIIQHGKRVGVATPTNEIIESLIETFDWRVYQRTARMHTRANGVHE